MLSYEEKVEKIGKYTIKYLYEKDDLLPPSVESFGVEWVEERKGRKFKMFSEVRGSLPMIEEDELVDDLEPALRKIKESTAGDLYFVSYLYYPIWMDGNEQEIEKNPKMKKIVRRITAGKMGACLIWKKRDGSQEKYCISHDTGGPLLGKDYDECDRERQRLENFFEKIKNNAMPFFERIHQEAVREKLLKSKKIQSKFGDYYYDVLYYLTHRVSYTEDEMDLRRGGDNDYNLRIWNIRHPKMLEEFWKEAKGIVHDVINEIKKDAKRYLTYNGKTFNERYLKMFGLLHEKIDLAMKTLTNITRAIYNEYKKLPNKERDKDVIYTKLAKESVLKRLDEGMNEYLNLLEKYGVIDMPHENFSGKDFSIEGIFAPAVWEDIRITDDTTDLLVYIYHAPVPKELEKEVEEEFEALKGKSIENLFV